MNAHHKLLLLKTSALAFLACSALAGSITVQKEVYLSHRFRGTISDITKVHSGKTNQILILAQSHGILIDDQKSILKEMTFKSCVDASATQIEGGPCLIYCRGGGFGPIYAADLNGKEQWRYDPGSSVFRVVRDSGGGYYVCTFRGVRVLDENGQVVQNFSERIKDVVFAKPLVLTISETPRSRALHLDFRNEKFEPLKSFPIEKGAFRIIAYNWPQTNKVSFITQKQLVVLDTERKMQASVDLGGDAITGSGVVFRDNQGGEFLALLILHPATESKSSLFLISKELKKVYEESLPPSRALSTLGSSNAVYVGVGATAIQQYRINQQ